MKYGIDEESKALDKYSFITSSTVVKSGLWINQNYAHLDATPDGLIYDDGKLCGIIENKSLKILKNRSVADLIKCSENAEIKKLLKRQCFFIDKDKLVLKRTHSYFFQV